MDERNDDFYFTAANELRRWLSAQDAVKLDLEPTWRHSAHDVLHTDCVSPRLAGSHVGLQNNSSCRQII